MHATGALRALALTTLFATSVIASADSSNFQVGKAAFMPGHAFAEVSAASEPTYLDWFPLDLLRPQPREWPPSVETILALVQQTWPEDTLRATRIVFCESKAGQHERTYDLDADNGGPMQISYYAWAAYFEALYGWSWQQIVTDLQVHFQAARHIYERSGWSAWGCY